MLRITFHHRHHTFASQVVLNAPIGALFIPTTLQPPTILRDIVAVIDESLTDGVTVGIDVVICSGMLLPSPLTV